MEQCQILREYAIYVARVRKYAKYMQLETAVQKAVDECIQEEILEEFLRKNRAEVIAVSIFEYDKEEEERKLRKAEFEAGEQSGIQKGIQEGIQEGKVNILCFISLQTRLIQILLPVFYPFQHLVHRR